ncbi:MAG: GatB/YqeY domain-containing protein [Acidobacteria bacterium]|nr:GatB/YqeY domain-containing protein [Acidobacteriota bacterium]
MALLDQIQRDMVAAMKAKEEVRLGAVRMIKTVLIKWQADNSKPLDEAAELQILSILVKQRKESIDMFRNAGREDAAAKEEAEMAIVESYMPAAPSAAEIDAAIEAAMVETGATEKGKMGIVMNAAKAKLAGKRLDGKVLSDKVKARLS